MDSSIVTTLFLGVIGFLISWFYSSRTHALAHEQMMKQLFTEFNHRYNELNNFLKEIEDDFKESLKVSDEDCLSIKAKKLLLRQKVIDYFILCAEEYYWYHHKRRIDKLIWISWQSGMNYWYQKVPAINELWKEELKASGKSSYYLTNDNAFFQDIPK